MNLWPHRWLPLEFGGRNLGKVLMNIPKFPVAGGGENKLGTPRWTLGLEQLVTEMSRLELGVCKAGGDWGLHLTCMERDTQPSKESSPRGCQ